jgi:hypothetical protein
MTIYGLTIGMRASRMLLWRKQASSHYRRAARIVIGCETIG